jgi:hypothetical protein
VREHPTVVSCEHPGCPAHLVIGESELVYDTETDVLAQAGWTSAHGSDDRCPAHRADLPA